MARVEYSREADDDLLEIVDYISRDNPAAAESIIARIDAACETIATESQAGELREGVGPSGCRSFTVGSYVIFFSTSTMAFG